MRFYRRAEDAASKILQVFQTGKVPQALAPVFINRKDNVPCRAWSWSNQLIVAFEGHSDARGYKQWQQAGRFVKKGEKSFPILVPIVRKGTRNNAETGQEEDYTYVSGFTSAAVFGFSQTDGEPLPPPDPAVLEWLDNLPLREVAESWGLRIEAYNGSDRAPLGRYRRGRAIAVGVENLSTWSHELVHSADDRLGRLTERGQHWRPETVAELGGATLLEILGFEREADRGGCFEYIQRYAADAGLQPVVAAQRVLRRTCDAVALILDTAEELRAAAESEVPA